jgi:hypothetical protein
MKEPGGQMDGRFCRTVSSSLVTMLVDDGDKKNRYTGRCVRGGSEVATTQSNQ